MLWTCGRWLLAVAAIILPATLLHAALSPESSDVSGPTSLVGQLLIASPQLHQPVFDHAVILVAQHSKDGALGIVINRPLGTRPMAGLLAAIGADASGISDDVRIFLGGPVDPTTGFVLHSADYHLPATMDIDGRVALTSTAAILRDIGLGKGPHKSIVAFGYAGWSPSQLEEEIARGVWTTAPEDVDLVFDEDRGKVWADALARAKASR